MIFFFFFQAEDGIRDIGVTGVQTCALPILTINYENKAISGVEFSVYQVADLKEDKTGYTIKPPFKWDGDFRNIKTANDQIKLSYDFELQSRNAEAVKKLQTGNDGKVSFTGLQDGIYLVVQTGAVGEAKNYTTFQSFLVMVPQFENGIWNKTVNAKPKPEIMQRDKPN